MNTRVIVSSLLVVLALMAVFFPKRENSIKERTPRKLMDQILKKEDYSLSVDQVAGMLTDEDSSLQLVDIRTPKEFSYCNIPGSLNIPFEELVKSDFEGYLGDQSKKTVFYSNDDVISWEAWVIAQREGFSTTYVMSGGLNEWFRTVMLSEFTGGVIRPEENALFEVRYKARRFFTRMNSLPDSLKTGFLAAKKAEEKKLVGGCE